ncbi:hypothetical protein PYCC9005_000644 [Savitreella phatthalungensis]
MHRDLAIVLCAAIPLITISIVGGWLLVARRSRLVRSHIEDDEALQLQLSKDTSVSLASVPVFTRSLSTAGTTFRSGSTTPTMLGLPPLVVIPPRTASPVSLELPAVSTAELPRALSMTTLSAMRGDSKSRLSSVLNASDSGDSTTESEHELAQSLQNRLSASTPDISKLAGWDVTLAQKAAVLDARTRSVASMSLPDLSLGTSSASESTIVCNDREEEKAVSSPIDYHDYEFDLSPFDTSLWAVLPKPEIENDGISVQQHVLRNKRLTTIAEESSGSGSRTSSSWTSWSAFGSAGGKEGVYGGPMV